MYYFAIDVQNADKIEIKKDLGIGSMKKHVRFMNIDHSYKSSYDFYSLFFALHKPLPYRGGCFYGVSNFSNSDFFLMKYSERIILSLHLESPDFLDSNQCKLIHEISKCFASGKLTNPTEELRCIRQELYNSVVHRKLQG